MRILCAINASEAIGKILDCLGLPSRPPPIYPRLKGSNLGYKDINRRQHKSGDEDINRRQHKSVD